MSRRQNHAQVQKRINEASQASPGCQAGQAGEGQVNP